MRFDVFNNMSNKICVNCKELKNTCEFHKNKSKKDGLQDSCKLCRKLKSIEKYEDRKVYNQDWYLKNKENIIRKSNLRYFEKKNEINYERKVRYKNDELYRQNQLSLNRNYYINNKEKILYHMKIWSESNKEKRNEISRKHYKKHITLMICRRLIKRALKFLGTKKEDSTIDILGYSPIDLKKHIDGKFIDGMTWENYGEWHIDHIKPISSFEKNEDPKIVNSLDNLQPLWAFDNLSKGCRY